MSAGRILGLAALYTLCGCSLLLDTSEYREVAEPGDVQIFSHEPEQVSEGATQPIILRGMGFSKNAVVSAVVTLPDGTVVTLPDGTDADVPVPQKLASGDRTELALLLEVPVLRGLDAEDGDVFVRITVSQGSSAATAELRLEALPEIQLVDNEVIKDGKLDALYSEIIVDGAVTATGNDPLRLVATHTIRIDRPLEAGGQDATIEGPGDGGPAGCAGGAGGVQTVNEGLGQNGGCDLGGGRAGAGARADGIASPGGGGGCMADTASGNTDEAHGDDTCTPELVPLGQPDNRGHGGGGGGAYESEVGGHGGGGGGAVELSAPRVTFGPNGALNARGGAGAPGDELDCNQNRYSGPGGGGSGGVVLLRADTVVFRREGVISVAGGAGGVTCDARGGRGSNGQVRIDVASTRLGDDPNAAPETIVDFFGRNVWRGPRLAAATPRLARSGRVSIEVRGDPRVTYDLQVDGDPSVEVRGDETVALMLERGFRVVCVAPRVVDTKSPESNHCLTIAVIDP